MLTKAFADEASELLLTRTTAPVSVNGWTASGFQSGELLAEYPGVITNVSPKSNTVIVNGQLLCYSERPLALGSCRYGAVAIASSARTEPVRSTELSLSIEKG